MRRLPLASSAPSYVVYRGPSALNGAPIVAILSGLDRPSKNTKTGPMAQLWILPADVAPHEAQKSGADAAVCGDCPLRPSAQGEVRCYVKTFQGPLATWRSNQAAPVQLAEGSSALRASGLALRLGAYGDPAALPREVVSALADACGHRLTGYTHQWRSATWLQSFAMASVEDGWTAAVARSKGWRTFRIGSEATRHEVTCPHVTRGVQCANCGLCSGTTSGAKSIQIPAH